jgi:hypothetical protein
MQLAHRFPRIYSKTYRLIVTGAILIAGSIFASTQPSYADTSTGTNTFCGSLSASVNAGPGNIFITCNLTIPAGLSFNIVPGSTMYVTPGKTITVKGSLNASNYNNLGAITLTTGIAVAQTNDLPEASENENPHSSYDLNPTSHNNTDQNAKNDNGQAIPKSGSYDLRLTPGSHLFLNQTTIDNAIITSTQSSSILENNQFNTSPLTVNTPSNVLIEANTFQDSPVILNNPANPVVGGNTFNVARGNPLTINNAANLALLGTFTDTSPSTPQSTIAINNSTDTGNWTVFPGSWLLNNTTLAPGSTTTILPGAQIGVAGTFVLNGRLQASRTSSDPAITLVNEGASTIQAGSGSILFTNGVTFNKLPLNAQDNTTIVVNSALNNSPQNVSSPLFGPVYQANVMSDSTLNLSGGQPSLGGNTITSSVPAISISNAWDISQIGSEAFTAGSNPLQIINNSTDKYTSNLPAGTYAINNLTIAPTGIFTPLPGSKLSFGTGGLIDNGIVQMARNSTDPPLIFTSQTPGIRWPLVVNSGTTFFARNASFNDVALTANPSPAVFTSASSIFTNSSIVGKDLANGPDLLSNTFTNTSLTLDGNPTQVMIGNTNLP